MRGVIMALRKKKNSDTQDIDETKKSLPSKSKNIVTILKLSGILILVILAVIMIVQNLSPIPVSFVFFTLPNVPVIAIILVSLVMGYLLGLLTYSILFGKKKKKLKKKRFGKKSDDTQLSDNE